MIRTDTLKGWVKPDLSPHHYHQHHLIWSFSNRLVFGLCNLPIYFSPNVSFLFRDFPLLPEVWTCERGVELRSSRERQNASSRIGGVYYFCPVFSFAVPSPRDPPPPIIWCQRGPHTNATRPHVLAHADIGKGQSTYIHSLRQLSLSSVLALSLFLYCFLSQRSVWLKDFLCFCLTQFFFFFFYKRSDRMCFSKIFPEFKKNSKQIFLIKTNPYPPAFCCFVSQPPPRCSPTISFGSSASSLSFPGSHAGDGWAAHRDGEGSKGEHEHLCTQRGSLGPGGERPHWGSKTGWHALVLDLTLHQNKHTRLRTQAARPGLQAHRTTKILNCTSLWLDV